VKIPQSYEILETQLALADKIIRTIVRTPVDLRTGFAGLMPDGFSQDGHAVCVGLAGAYVAVYPPEKEVEKK
jgi:hypothetical protein